MVYKFLQGLDDIIGESAADDYLDLIAVGMVGDMADTTNPEVQLLIRKGLTNVCNPMFESIIEKQSFSIKGKINQMTFSFNIIPLINAATRIADYEDMKIIVEAFCGINPDREFEYEPSRGKNKGELLIETLYEYTARLLVSIKGKQDRAVKKVLEGSKRPPQVGLYDILDGTTSDKKVLLIDATDYIEEGGLSGLLANKIRSRYNRPTLVVSRNEKGKYRGSGRGEQIEMFRSKLEKSEHILFAQGHEPAFGFMLNIPEPEVKQDAEQSTEPVKPDIKQIEADLNKMFENEDTNAEYVVDFSLHGDFIEDYMIEELCQLEDYWGNGIDKPVFHVYDIVVSSEAIDTGKEESKFSFVHNDIEFILFKPSPEKMAELVDWSDTMCYNLIGEPNINEFDGRRIIQIIISAIERVKLDSDELDSNNDWDDVPEVEETTNKKEEVEDDFEW